MGIREGDESIANTIEERRCGWVVVSMVLIRGRKEREEVKSGCFAGLSIHVTMYPLTDC